MSVPKKVKSYLDKKGVDYEELAHRTVYTAYDAAQTLKKELKEIAKNLLIKADNTYALIIVPADKRLDLKKLKKSLGAKKISIPDEKVMVKILKVKPGAISSFGKLHKLETVIDKAMVKTKKAVFATGSFSDSVFMKVKDFIEVEEAKMADIAMKGGYVVPKKIKKKMKKTVAKVKSKKVKSKQTTKKIKKTPVKKKTIKKVAVKKSAVKKRKK